MDRREAIKRISLLMGGTLSASAMTGLLGGCRFGPVTEPFVPQTMTPQQNDLVTALAEFIIPETDTPGAGAARVNEFIDKMLTDWFEPDERDHFLAGLGTVETRAQEAGGRFFLDLAPEERADVLTAMEEEAFQDERAAMQRPPEGWKPPFFSMMKGLTVLGYYTSEIGATQELLDMPFGTYDGAVPFDEIGRAWA